MNLLIPFISLVLDWLDAIGSALAIVALFHPALRPRRGRLIPRPPRWAGFLFDRRSDLDRFIEAARACSLAKAPAAARREVPRRLGVVARHGPERP